MLAAIHIATETEEYQKGIAIGNSLLKALNADTIQNTNRISNTLFELSKCFSGLDDYPTAIKYNKECGYIKIYSKIKGDFAEIFVEDNGIGIDFKEKENIFKAFYRIEGNEEKGSGLGLSLVKETIKIHGGEIQVLNKEKGCLIKVSLPISNL